MFCLFYIYIVVAAVDGYVRAPYTSTSSLHKTTCFASLQPMEAFCCVVHDVYMPSVFT